MLEILQNAAAYAGQFAVFAIAIVGCLLVIDVAATFILRWCGAYHTILRAVWEILTRRHAERRAEGTR